MLKAVPSDSNQLESEENQIPFQSVSMDIWDKKYRLKSKQGTFVDNDIEDTYNRVAKALAEVEIPEKGIYGTKDLYGRYNAELFLQVVLPPTLEH